MASRRWASAIRARAAVACHNPASSSEPISRVPSSPMTPFGSRHSRTPPSRMSANRNVVAGTPNSPAASGWARTSRSRDSSGATRPGPLPGGQGVEALPELGEGDPLPGVEAVDHRRDPPGPPAGVRQQPRQMRQGRAGQVGEGEQGVVADVGGAVPPPPGPDLRHHAGDGGGHVVRGTAVHGRVEQVDRRGRGRSRPGRR